MSSMPHWIGAAFGVISGICVLLACYTVVHLNPSGLGLAALHGAAPGLFLIDVLPLALGAAGWYVGECRSRASLARLHLERLQTAIDRAPVSVMLCSGEPPYNVVQVNSAYEKLTGYTREEAVGRPCDYLQAGSRQINDKALSELKQGIAAREDVSVVFRNARKSGEFFWNQLSVYRIAGEEACSEMLVGIQLDVTTQHQFCAQKEAYNKELDRWRRVFIARQARSLSLKAEVNQLRARLGLPEKYVSHALPSSHQRGERD